MATTSNPMIPGFPWPPLFVWQGDLDAEQVA
jgi:hypothetical protein